MKNHTLTYEISGINLPQFGCDLDKLEWTRVLNINLCLFAKTGIRVNIFLQEVQRNSNLDNALLKEEDRNDKRTQVEVFYIAKARKLALGGMLKTPTSDRNDRETKLRAANIERRA